MKIKLKSEIDSDFVDVANFVDEVIASAKYTDKQKLNIAKLLYEYRDSPRRTIVSGGDQFYSPGRGWVVSRMARLLSYSDSLPDSIKKQYTPQGHRIDPLGSLTYDPKAQEKFLLWYDKNSNEKEAEQGTAPNP